MQSYREPFARGLLFHLVDEVVARNGELLLNHIAHGH